MPKKYQPKNSETRWTFQDQYFCKTFTNTVASKKSTKATVKNVGISWSRSKPRLKIKWADKISTDSDESERDVSQSQEIGTIPLTKFWQIWEKISQKKETSSTTTKKQSKRCWILIHNSILSHKITKKTKKIYFF